MDELTLLLAIWGALLSTYLALREVRKDKRQVKMLKNSSIANSFVFCI